MAVSGVVRFEDFHPERARFRSWIFGIAKSVLMEIFKSFRGGAIGLADQTASVLLLENIPAELPHEQVAVHLGINEDAAQKRWVRLRDRLRQQGLPEGVIES